MSAALHRGHAQALGAALCWGLIPIYFKWLAHVGALEVVAHRILWTVPLLLVILWLRREGALLAAAVGDGRVRRALFASAALIAVNWLVYVWAVQTDHIVAASLGYFISPLLSVLLGALFLRERLGPMQWGAVALAGAGVAVLGAGALSTMWVSLLLAGSWALYSLVRKLTPVGPVAGLAIETGLLWPVMTAYLLWLAIVGGGTAFGGDATTSILLAGGAAVTAVPLLLFAAAVRTVPLSTMGLMQYIAPILQFLIGVFVYDEPLTTAHLIAFPLIWFGLALYTAASWRAAGTAAR